MASGNSQILLKSPDATRSRYHFCDAHFDDASFTNKMRNRLKYDAVPTKSTRPFLSSELIDEFINNLNTWKGKHD